MIVPIDLQGESEGLISSSLCVPWCIFRTVGYLPLALSSVTMRLMSAEGLEVRDYPLIAMHALARDIRL